MIDGSCAVFTFAIDGKISSSYPEKGVEVGQLRLVDDVVRDAGHPRLVLRRHEQIRVGGLAEIEFRAGVRVDDGNLVGRLRAGSVAGSVMRILGIGVIARQIDRLNSPPVVDLSRRY